MNLKELQVFLDSINQPRFRFKQIVKNYFSGKFNSFKEMSNLSLDLRETLEKNLPLSSNVLETLQEDKSTKKALLRLSDGEKIETVLMEYEGWTTACISSQVGCALGCKFCATGKIGFRRNLTAEEMIDQITFWNNRMYPKTVSRVVFMGMGEPFLNWDNFVEAIETINSKEGLTIGSRKISISTAGIIDKIKAFADLDTQINLAISLHSINQEQRESIMPIANKYSLDDLKEACEYYTKNTNRQIFFEYALMKDVNDSNEDARELAKFINSNSLYYLNIIQLNEIEGGITPSTKKRTDLFLNKLDKNRVAYSVRRSFGSKIQAACGQLAGK
jgi:23S rRNA (adenine2503-C2)-methyltransferase